MDYALDQRYSNTNPDLNESIQRVCLLLQNAKLLQAEAGKFALKNQTGIDNNCNSSILSDNVSCEEYVTDVYCVSINTNTCSISIEEGQTKGWTAEETDDLMTYPVITIPGLSVTSDGSAEIVFEYDSDWSDLAEDEDPDSNDERYFGNDYPDEESEEEQGFRYYNF